MENRFLYRGKRSDNGEWIIGSLLVDKQQDIETGEQIEIIGIYPSEYKDFAKKIDPSTICQCTGLKDKNGNLIWENDIVKDKNGNLYKAFWQDNYYQFSWICIKSNSLPVGAKWDFYSIRSFEIEVIGNVFDNPELLEVGE